MMKKNLLFLFGIFLFVACSTDSYKISGSIDSNAGKQDGTVYIKKRIIREWVTVDSTKIENGKFTFKGNVENPYAAYLVYTGKDDRTEYVDFIIEVGEINLTINDSSIQRLGTAQNILLQKFHDHSYEQNDILEIVDFILQNSNTAVGNYIFTQTYYAMSVEEKELVIHSMDENSLAYDRIPLIIKGMEVERKTTIGQHYLDIALPDINGDTLALSSIVGKYNYVMVDFWASWCSPCRASFPALATLYNKYVNTGKFEIYGVSLDNKKDDWLSLIAKEGLKWKQVSDLKGWESAGAQQYGINAIPSTVLIDKNGIIVGRNLETVEIENVLNLIK